MRVEFTIALLQCKDHPAIDYRLSAETVDGQITRGSIECESFVVYHGRHGDETYPDNSSAVLDSIWEKHRDYIRREAAKAAGLERSRIERDANETQEPGTDSGMTTDRLPAEAGRAPLALKSSACIR